MVGMAMENEPCIIMVEFLPYLIAIPHLWYGRLKGVVIWFSIGYPQVNLWFVDYGMVLVYSMGVDLIKNNSINKLLISYS